MLIPIKAYPSSGQKWSGTRVAIPDESKWLNLLANRGLQKFSRFNKAFYPIYLLLFIGCIFPLLKWKLFPTCIQNLPARSRCTDSSDGLRKWFSHFEEPLGHRRAIFHRVTHQLDRRKFHLRKDLTWPASEWQNWTWPHHFIIISEKTGFLNDEIQSYECRSLKVPVPD